MCARAWACVKGGDLHYFFFFFVFADKLYVAFILYILCKLHLKTECNK